MVEFMLAKEFNCLKDKLPTGWYVSDKYDGYRARYMGESNKTFLSRQGNYLTLRNGLLKPCLITILTVVVGGRDNFQDMGKSGVRTRKMLGRISNISYMIYQITLFALED